MTRSAAAHNVANFSHATELQVVYNGEVRRPFYQFDQWVLYIAHHRGKLVEEQGQIVSIAWSLPTPNVTNHVWSYDWDFTMREAGFLYFVIPYDDLADYRVLQEYQVQATLAEDFAQKMTDARNRFINDLIQKHRQ
jgi:hypothetical protein